MRSVAGSRSWWVITALLTLAACKPATVEHGSATSPWGAPEKVGKGCASLQGVYAWPPAEGYWAEGGGRGRYDYPWMGEIPAKLPGPEGQVWIREVDGGLQISTQQALRVQPGTRGHWEVKRHAKDKLTCNAGHVDLAERELGVLLKGYAPRIMVGVRFARLPDGSLAIGVRKNESGNKGALYSWADVSLGSLPASDEVFWEWSRLTRLADGATEPPVLMPTRQPGR